MGEIPLALLRTFEAAARLESYSRAANELHVTHSAVSQQIRTLEDALGVKLFARQDRLMLLTEHGAKLFRHVGASIRDLRRVGDVMRTDEGKVGSVNLTTIPSLATLWLIPRLHRFQAAAPDVKVSVETSIVVQSLDVGKFDLALRHGAGSWPRCDSIRLFDETLFPICSPHFNGGDWPETPAQLSDFRLLSYTDSKEWSIWAKHVGVNPAALNPTLVLSDAALMIAATVAGQGIAIGRSIIVSDHLHRGELVRLLPEHAVPAHLSYYAVTPRSRQPSPGVQHFIDWLLLEAAETSRIVGGITAD
jgi:LysR family glycine cleavage system transcriptional activator